MVRKNRSVIVLAVVFFVLGLLGQHLYDREHASRLRSDDKVSTQTARISGLDAKVAELESQLASTLAVASANAAAVEALKEQVRQRGGVPVANSTPNPAANTAPTTTPPTNPPRTCIDLIIACV